MMHLPRDLQPWEAELGIFPREVALGLGGLVARLAIAIGPMRARALRGSGEPDGFDGIARRGDYERLLMTEWLLAEEVPHEFLRRMVMGEHAFLLRARKRPATARHSVVLFDGGAEQLGSPRVAQIAALVVFARRAAEARASLSWGRLGAPRAPLADGFTREGVRALLDMRTRRAATADDVRAAAVRHAPVGADELWIVGGPSLRDAAAEARASSLQVEELLLPEQLRVTVRPAHGAPRACLLDVPAGGACARLLRDPFQIAVATAAHAAARFSPNGGVILTQDGRRLFARGEDGSLLTMPLPGSARAGAPRVARFTVKEGRRVVAAGWARAAKRVVAVTEHEGRDYYAHLLSRRADRANTTFAHGAIAEPPPPRTAADALGVAHRAPDGAIYFVDGARRLVRLARGAPPEPLVEDVVGFVSGRGRFAIARVIVGEEGVAVALDTWAEDGVKTLAFVRVHPGATNEVFFGAVDPVALAAVHTQKDTWTILRGAEREELRVPAGLQVCGVVEKDWSPPRAALVCVDAARTRLLLLRAEVLEELCEVPGRVAYATVSGGARDVAFVSERGEVGVYSLVRDGVIARLRRDAS
jgi:hypothetical protein